MVLKLCSLEILSPRIFLLVLNPTTRGRTQTGGLRNRRKGMWRGMRGKGCNTQRLPSPRLTRGGSQSRPGQEESRDSSWQLLRQPRWSNNWDEPCGRSLDFPDRRVNSYWNSTDIRMHMRNEEDEYSAAFICCVTKLLAPGGAAFGETRKFTMREAKRILGTDLVYMIRKSKKGQWTNDETRLDKT